MDASIIMSQELRGIKTYLKQDRIPVIDDNRDLYKVLAIASKYNLSTPQSTAQAIVNAARLYKHLDVDLICAVITHESANTWDPTVVSPAGALGLMQIMPTTGFAFHHRFPSMIWTNSKTVLTNPTYNIMLGCYYLNVLIERHKHIYVALAFYNGPHRNALNFKRALYAKDSDPHAFLLEETQKYIPAVMTLYQEYQQIKNL